LFFGNNMGSYVGAMVYNKGMSSSEISYYFDYAKAFDNAFSGVEKMGFNFKVHTPFAQGAFIVDIKGSDLNSQIGELITKLNGDSISKNGNLQASGNGQVSNGNGKGNGVNGNGKNGKGKKHPYGEQIFSRRDDRPTRDILPSEALLRHNPGN
jgi:hypothetical protein